MPRKVVLLENSEVYHIFNRGVDKRHIFFDNSDYLRFYNSLKYFNTVEPTTSLFESIRISKNSIKQKPQNCLVRIHAYCLLPNHFHLLVTQISDVGISEFMKRVGGGYTSYFNERYERSGSLFQGTFKRAHIGTNEKLLYISAYINYNHVVHGMDGGNQLFQSSRAIFNHEKTSTFIYPDIILNQLSASTPYENSALPLAKKIHQERIAEKKFRQPNHVDPYPEFLE